MKRPPLLLLLTTCALTACTVVACSRNDSSAMSTTSALHVRTVAVAPGPEAIMDTYSGIVRARQESDVAARITGRIEKKLRLAGSVVHQGDALYRIDRRELLQTLNAARADVEAAQAEVDIARADLVRWEQLIARDAASRQSWEQALRTQRSADARLTVARARLDVADSQLAETVIEAPFDGILVETHAEEGEVVTMGTPLARVASQGAREADIRLPDSVTPPAQAQAFLPGQPPVPLSLVEAAGALDPSTRTRRVRYAFPAGSTPTLGGIVRIALPVVPLAGTPVTAVRVPVAAVSDRGRGPEVWVVHEGKTDPVAVTVLMMDPTTATVVGPLATGTSVVALGTHLLEPGMAVRDVTR